MGARLSLLRFTPLPWVKPKALEWGYPSLPQLFGHWRLKQPWVGLSGPKWGIGSSGGRTTGLIPHLGPILPLPSFALLHAPKTCTAHQQSLTWLLRRHVNLRVAVRPNAACWVPAPGPLAVHMLQMWFKAYYRHTMPTLNSSPRVKSPGDWAHLGLESSHTHPANGC